MPQQQFAIGTPVKVRFRDMKAMGLITSRFDLHMKIKAGKIRAPIKDGDNMQSTAWWWWVDVLEDLERERTLTKVTNTNAN